MRLTNNDYLTDVFHYKNHKTQWEYNNELWQYVKEREDIEEELGIDLLTLIKANNDGAYFKEDLRHYIANIDLKHKCVRLVKHYEAEDDFDCHYVMFKDYGKTWALTKGELE